MDRLMDLIKDGGSQLLVITPQWYYQANMDLLKEFYNHIAKEKKGETLVSQTKAAEQLGVTSSTMYRWTGKGLLHPQKIGGKVLYRQSELDKLKGI
jgi:excisionase family DNA binding protein